MLAEGHRVISEFYSDPDRIQADFARTGASFDRTRHGTPVLHGALAYLECRLYTAQGAGDHTIFIAEVEDIVVREGNPLAVLWRKVSRYCAVTSEAIAHQIL